jgi:hypothetical protein
LYIYPKEENKGGGGKKRLPEKYPFLIQFLILKDMAISNNSGNIS